MNSSAIAPDRVIFSGNTSLTEIGKSLQTALGSEIVQGGYHLKCRSRRIGSVCSSVQQTAVIGIIYQCVPVLGNSIRVKVRSAHFHQNLTCRGFYGNNRPSPVTKCIIGS